MVLFGLPLAAFCSYALCLVSFCSRGFAADAKSGAGAPKTGAGPPKAKGGQPAPKKKERQVITLKQPNSGVKFGHGAKNRLNREELRAQARSESLTAQAAAATAAEEVHTDDEELQQLYDLVNSKRVDYRGVDPAVLSKPLPPAAARMGEELWQRQDAARAEGFRGAFVIPDEFKGKVRIVKDDFDELAMTDLELTDDELDSEVVGGDDVEAAFEAGETGAASGASAAGGDGETPDGFDLVENYAEMDPSRLAVLLKHGGVRPSRESDKLPGSRIAMALADLKRHRLEKAAKSAGHASLNADSGKAPAGGTAADPRDAKMQRRVKDARAAASTLSDLLADSGDEKTGPSERSRLRSQAREGAVRDAATLDKRASMRGDREGGGGGEGEEDGYTSPHSRTLLMDSSDDEFKPYPQLPLPRPSLFRVRGEPSLASEDDALVEEQAKQLLEAASKEGTSAAAQQRAEARAAAKRASQLVSLSGDDSSDWGGDEADPRFRVDPLTQARDLRMRYGLGDSDEEAEKLLDLGIDAAGTRISGAFGDGIEKLPDQVLQELATPYDFTEFKEGKPYPDAVTVRGKDSHSARMPDSVCVCVCVLLTSAPAAILVSLRRVHPAILFVCRGCHVSRGAYLGRAAQEVARPD